MHFLHLTHLHPFKNFPGSFARIPVLGTTYTFLSTLAFVGKFFSHLVKRNDILHHVWQDSVSPLDPAYYR